MSKAWIVRDEQEGFAVVAFHHHGLAARRIGSHKLELDFEDTECSRAPEFDQFAEAGEVPAKVLIEDGWWMECHECGTKITQDSDLSDLVEMGGFSVYCNSKCKADFEARKKAHKVRAEKFKAAVRRERPDLEFTEFFCDWPFITFQANFTFPGSKYGGSVRSQLGDSTDLTWHMANGDLEAWEGYERSRKEQSA